MATFIFAANSVLPIIMIILLGYWLRQIGFFDKGFLKKANKLVFNIGIPSYLFYNVYNIDGFSEVNWEIVIYCVIMIVAIFSLSIVATLLFTKDSGTRGVLIQCAYRSNFAIIGLTLAESMGGKEAVGIAAVLSAFSIPLFNMIAVITLSVFGERGKDGFSLASVIKSIMKNPLIIGCLLGLICLVVRSFMPINEAGEPVFTIKNNLPFVYKAVASMSGIATPLALLVLGGQFKFSAVKELAGKIIYGCTWRLVIAPLAGIAIFALLCSKGIMTMDSNCYPSLVALFGSPVAVSSAIMAEEMKCNGELARQLVVWTSLGSIFSVFVIIVLLRGFGLV